MGYDGTLKFDTSIDSSGFQNGINKISSYASGALKATGAIIGGVASAVVGIGTAAIKTGADFEAAMSNVSAISGATGSDLKDLTDKAKEMGAKTKFSATQSADAFSYMAMAGWKTADMLDGIEGIMNLAAASGEDLATTSDIVTDALTAFGLSAKDSTHFADVLAKASSNANTNVSLMGETFKYVAPVAGALGFSAEDCATAIGLMANSGIKASQAGTSLRSIITRMAKPTKDVQSAMTALRVSLTKSDGSMKSLNEIMVDLRKGFSNLTADQKAQMAATLGGQEAMSGLLAIVNSSDKDFNDLTNSIANCKDAAKDMADTMNDNLSGQITILKSGLEGLAISLYEEMETPLKGVVKQVQKMVQELQDAFNNGGLDALVDKTGEVMAEIVTQVAKAAPELIGTAENLVGSFIQSLLEHKSEFSSAGASMVAELVKAITNVSGDMWSAGIYLFTEFLQAMTSHSEEIGQSFGEMIAKIGDAVQENMPLIIRAGKDFVAGFCQGLSAEFPGVSALLKGFFDGLLSTAGTMAEGLIDLLSKIFGVIDSQNPAAMEAIGKAIGTIVAAVIGLNAAQNVAGSMKSLFSILGTLKGGVTSITGVVGKAVEGFALWSGGAGTLGEVIALQFPTLAAFGTKISGLTATVVKFFSTFGTTIAGVGSLISGAILAVTSFADMFQNGFSTVKEILMGVGVALTALGAVVLGAPAVVTAVIAGIVFAVANMAIAIKQHWSEISSFVQQIPSEIGKVVDAVVAWFEALPRRISVFLAENIANVQSWASDLLSEASNAAQNTVNAVAYFFSNLPYKVGYVLGLVIGKMASFGIDAINWVTKNVPIIINDIVTFFSQLPGKVWNWLVNTYNKLVTWGNNMLQKASEAARNTVESVSTFFSELPGKVAKWLQNTLTNLSTWGSNMLSKGRQAASNTINAIVTFFSQLPGKIATQLNNAASKVVAWGSQLAAKGRSAALKLVNAVVSAASSLPSKMTDIGRNIVQGVWSGISNAAGWFRSKVNSFFSGIVSGVKSGLGIHSPSKVFASEVGKWIPPGVGEGIKEQMPELEDETNKEMQALAQKMQAAVNIETGKISIDKNTSQTYKVDQENGQSFDDRKTNVVIEGETHVHVDLDGKEIAEVTTPYIDENLGKRYDLEERGV